MFNNSLCTIIIIADAWAWIYGVISSTMNDAGIQYLKDIAASVAASKKSQCIK